jgi:hypothetical protein
MWPTDRATKRDSLSVSPLGLDVLTDVLKVWRRRIAHFPKHHGGRRAVIVARADGVSVISALPHPRGPQAAFGELCAAVDAPPMARAFAARPVEHLKKSIDMANAIKHLKRTQKTAQSTSWHR